MPAEFNDTASGLQLRQLERPDVAAFATEFAELGWTGKDVSKFEGYLADQAGGRRDVIVAEVDGRAVGYIIVTWTSNYVPFSVAGIPEIQV